MDQRSQTGRDASKALGDNGGLAGGRQGPSLDTATRLEDARFGFDFGINYRLSAPHTRLCGPFGTPPIVIWSNSVMPAGAFWSNRREGDFCERPFVGIAER